VPDVSLFDARYHAQRSVRSNVNWSGAVIGNRFVAGVDATYSINLNQTGIDNLNFDPSVRFRLAGEGQSTDLRPRVEHRWLDWIGGAIRRAAQRELRKRSRAAL
jgi:hypothetical protein